jgi:hypothetical protein
VTRLVEVDATLLISRLAFAQLTGVAGTIQSLTYCRVDRQPPPSGGANIQIQLNGVNGNSSVATCVIASTVLSSLAKWPPGLRQHQEGWLVRQTRIALTESLRTFCIIHIVGSFNDADNPANLTPRKGARYACRQRRPSTIKGGTTMHRSLRRQD